jgi:hypothetical protein
MTQRHTTPTAVAGLAAALAIVPMNMLCMDMLGFVGAAVANSFTYAHPPRSSLRSALRCHRMTSDGLRVLARGWLSGTGK